jgi:hypothetical protein
LGQCLAQRRDVHTQANPIGSPLWPNALDQSPSADDLVRLFHQDHQDVHGPCSEWHNLRAVGQEPVEYRQLERTEAHDFPIFTAHRVFLVHAGTWGRSSLLHLAFATPAGRTLAKGLPEKPAQMCLIGKSNAQGDLAQRS